MVDFDFHILDIAQRRSQRQQARERGLIDERVLGENEVVCRLRLDNSGRGRSGQRRDFTIGISGRKRKGTREGRLGEQQEQGNIYT